MTSKFARSLYATTALSFAFVALPAHAQDAAPAEETTAPADAAQQADDAEIVVTGIRASLASSARIKRNQANIVEVVSAEDIGKLPDVSIADSLARLPGVTAQRLEGRDQRLSIRGLGPDFGVTLLNGREQVTVGDNRGVEYDQYPSEFFKNVVVAKSANASLLPAGIAGTVDLRMLRPLDTSKPVVAVQLRGQLNSQDKLNPEGKRFGYRASATLVDQFADDTIGVALGVSVTSTPTQNERYNAWGFPTDGSVGGNAILGGAKPYVQSSILDRKGVVGTIEFKPNDRVHVTLDALYSKFKERQYLRGIEFPINPGWGAGTTVTSYTAEDGLVTNATIANVVGVVRNDYNRRTADNFSIGLNNVFGLTDKVRLTVDASWSKADRTDFLLENYIGTGYGTTGAKDTINISLNDNGTYDIVPTLDYANPANFRITDPRGWGFNGTTAVVQAGFLNKPRFKDDLKALRASLDGDLDWKWANRWEIGANYSRRSKDALYRSAFLCPKDGNPDCTVSGGSALSLAIPQDAVVGTVPLDYLGVPGMVALDPLYLYNNVYDVAFDDRPDSLARDYNVTEKVFTGYAMIDLGNGGPIKGNIGAQLVHTKQSSDGFNSSVSGGVVTAAVAQDGTSFTRFLPSASLSIELTQATYLKLGASRTMIRPRVDQERVTNVVGLDFSCLGSADVTDCAFFTAYGGNARLLPYMSLNFDASFEKYFSKGGYVALTAFHKKLSDYIDPNSSFVADFSEYAALLPAAIRAQLATTDGRVSGPRNTGKGHLTGVELTLSLPFVNLTQSLDGFGFFGSVSHVDSKVKYQSAPGGIEIPGQSRWVGTAEGYYEKNGFQARVSYRYRSDFIGEVAGLSAAPTFRTAQAEGILDAQIGYELQGGPLKGLSILLQGKNLTDQPFTTFDGNSNRVIDYQRYGRDFYLGLSYKF